MMRTVTIFLLALGGLVLSMGSVRAQEGGTALYVVRAPGAVETVALEERASRWLVARGERAEPLARAPLDPGLDIDAAQLAVLTEVESALREARALAARFEEREALRMLGEAREGLLAALEIPHAHAWLAELELAIGLCAAQLGELRLAEGALARAASLDPMRRLQAGEASPAALQLAQQVEQRREGTHPSHVRVEAEPADAQLWLDGRELGASPRELAVPSGAHVLTVRAPSHLPYARVVEFLPGRRLPLRIHLSPRPELAARNALVSGDDETRAQEAATALHDATGRAVWLFTADEHGATRVVHCAATCRPVRAPELTSNEPGPVAAPASRSERPFWRRWPVWVVSSAVLASGLVAGLLAGREESVRRERQLSLDPGELPR